MSPLYGSRHSHARPRAYPAPIEGFAALADPGLSVRALLSAPEGLEDWQERFLELCAEHGLAHRERARLAALLSEVADPHAGRVRWLASEWRALPATELLDALPLSESGALVLKLSANPENALWSRLWEEANLEACRRHERRIDELTGRRSRRRSQLGLWKIRPQGWPLRRARWEPSLPATNQLDGGWAERALSEIAAGAGLAGGLAEGITARALAKTCF